MFSSVICTSLLQALADNDPELSDWLSSLQLANLKNTEIALLTDLRKHPRTKEKTVSQVINRKEAETLFPFAIH